MAKRMSIDRVVCFEDLSSALVGLTSTEYHFFAAVHGTRMAFAWQVCHSSHRLAIADQCLHPCLVFVVTIASGSCMQKKHKNQGGVGGVMIGSVVSMVVVAIVVMTVVVVLLIRAFRAWLTHGMRRGVCVGWVGEWV